MYSLTNLIEKALQYKDVFLCNFMDIKKILDHTAQSQALERIQINHLI